MRRWPRISGDARNKRLNFFPKQPIQVLDCFNLRLENMELIQDPIAASVSAREIEPGIADVAFRGTPSSRQGEDRTAEAGSPESGKKTHTSSSKPSDEAFIRHTGPEPPSPAGKSHTTTTDGESREAVSEERTGNDARENESGEGKENEPNDVQGPSVFSPEGVEVQRLVQTDRRVRAHEHAHIAAGGSIRGFRGQFFLSAGTGWKALRRGGRGEYRHLRNFGRPRGHHPKNAADPQRRSGAFRPFVPRIAPWRQRRAKSKLVQGRKHFI